MSYDISVDMIKEALPPQLKPKANQALVDKLVNTFNDPDMIENFMETFISYTHVLQNSRFQMDNYINAVKYVSYKLMGLTNFDAYTKTFPDRYRNHLAKGTSIDVLHTYVHAYNKTPLVSQISEQTLIAPSILYQAEFHQALMVQVEIMNDQNVSPKTRSDAAAHVMNITQPPAVKKLQLDVGITDKTGTMGAFMDKLDDYAQNAREAIKTRQLTATDVIEHTFDNGE